jgi:hypothetical protein
MSHTIAEEPVRTVAEFPLSRGRLVLSLQGEPAPWVEPTLKKLGQLLTLPFNWNSYGAKAIDLARVVAAWQLLTAIMREETPPPAVVPTSRGGIQLEWHTRGIDLEIEIVAPGQFAVSFEDAVAGDTWEEDVRDNLDQLAARVAYLSRSSQSS